MDTFEMLGVLHDRLLYDEGVENILIDGEHDQIVVIFSDGKRFKVTVEEQL